jgi:hypothetical protein
LRGSVDSVGDEVGDEVDFGRRDRVLARAVNEMRVWIGGAARTLPGASRT